VTCVFDGAEVQVRVAAAALRRVRVRFSPAGQTADELIRQLARAEPTGRPVTVVSSDKEVVDGVRRAGARTLTSRALLDRLDRA
jgi:predicted RNA-binding protein with PIN domain